MVLLQLIYKSFLNGVVGLQAQGGIIIDILQTIQSVIHAYTITLNIFPNKNRLDFPDHQIHP